MADGAPADEDLGHLANVQRGHCAHLAAGCFDCVLQRQTVDHGRQHAGIVRSRLGHAQFAGQTAAKQVAASDDHTNLDPAAAAFDNLSSDVVQGCGVDAGVALTLQRFAGNLEDDSGCVRLIGHNVCAKPGDSITNCYSPIS